MIAKQITLFHSPPTGFNSFKEFPEIENANGTQFSANPPNGIHLLNRPKLEYANRHREIAKYTNELFCAEFLFARRMHRVCKNFAGCQPSNSSMLFHSIPMYICNTFLTSRFIFFNALSIYDIAENRLP